MHPEAARLLFDQQVGRLPKRLIEVRGWTIHAAGFPIFDCSFAATGRTTLRVQMMCDNWNDDPPSIALLAPDGTPLNALLPDPTSVFNNGQHPATGRPFVCMAGSREFHTHPGHLSESWDGIKGQPRFDVGGIMTQLWNAWKKGSA